MRRLAPNAAAACLDELYGESSGIGSLPDIDETITTRGAARERGEPAAAERWRNRALCRSAE